MSKRFLSYIICFIASLACSEYSNGYDMQGDMGYISKPSATLYIYGGNTTPNPSGMSMANTAINTTLNPSGTHTAHTETSITHIARSMSTAQILPYLEIRTVNSTDTSRPTNTRRSGPTMNSSMSSVKIMRRYARMLVTGTTRSSKLI